MNEEDREAVFRYAQEMKELCTRALNEIDGPPPDSLQGLSFNCISALSESLQTHPSTNPTDPPINLPYLAAEKKMQIEAVQNADRASNEMGGELRTGPLEQKVKGIGFGRGWKTILFEATLRPNALTLRDTTPPKKGKEQSVAVLPITKVSSIHVNGELARNSKNEHSKKFQYGKNKRSKKYQYSKNEFS
jgi:hypothetical protein